MQWLVGGGQLVVGIGLLAAWWIALSVVSRRADPTKPLSTVAFAVLPTVFMLWCVAGVVLVMHGIGLI